MKPEKPLSELTALWWPDGRPKIAPVQGYVQGIPWSLHLKAYNAYCKKYGRQDALIDLEDRGCRGGFSTGELDDFVPGWRNEVEELSLLKKEVERLQKELRLLKLTADVGWECPNCGLRTVTESELIAELSKTYKRG